MNFPINQGFSQLQAWKYQLALYAQQNPVAANALAPLISPHFGADALLRGGFGQGGFQTPGFGHSPCGCVPQPNIQFSGAPAGVDSLRAKLKLNENVYQQYYLKRSA